MGSPFSRVGVTGYPQSHPKIGDDVTIQAMWDKRHRATYLVSNLCFDPVTLRRWIARVRARGVTLPMFVGIAGPVDRARLVRMAAKAGVAESARFLAGHTGWFLRLGAPRGYSPDRLLERTGATLAAPASAVEGLHVFTFNQVRQTEQWRRALDRSGVPNRPAPGPPTQGRRRVPARPRVPAARSRTRVLSVTAPRVAIGPARNGFAEQAVRDGGGEPVDVDASAEALVWLN